MGSACDAGEEYEWEPRKTNVEYPVITPEKRKDARAKVEEKTKLMALLKREDNFGRCVREAAGLKEDDTTELILKKLERCESLILRDFGEPLRSLEDLPLLPNLKSLSVWMWEEDSVIEDFTPVTELSRLEELSIEYAEQEIDISFLAEMDTITDLSLGNCRIENIAVLESMPRLKRLSLYETSIDDFTFLGKLTGLTELELINNAGAEHMEMIEKLYGLQTLTLQKCSIADIGFLSGLTELQSVDLSENFITDLTPLENMQKLERLDAVENRIKDISPLNDLSDLCELALSENEITDISPLKDLSNLYKVALDGNKVRDISSLSGISHLNQVELSGNLIADLSPLAEKEELIYLSVSENPYTDLMPVWEVPMLSFICQEVTDKERQIVENWMKEQCPEITKYECIDYVEGDLDKDGRTDIAFVIDCPSENTYGSDDETLWENRYLFVLLKEKGNSFRKLAKLKLGDRYSGGARENPYRGTFLGDGYLVSKDGWGSGIGGTSTNIYFYQKEKLERVKEIRVENENNRDIYDVQVTDMENDAWFRYEIFLNDRHLVKSDIKDSEDSLYGTFPGIDPDIIASFTRKTEHGRNDRDGVICQLKCGGDQEGYSTVSA